MRPARIPLDERFLGKYAVNSLPITNKGNARASHSSHKDAKSQHGQKSLGKHGVVGNTCENPNFIPIH